MCVSISEKPKPKTYTAEFKASVVKLALESGRPMSQTVRELGLSKDTLYGWVRQHQGTRPPDAEKTASAEPLYEGLKRLRREVSILKEERDILKNGPPGAQRSAPVGLETRGGVD